MNVVQHFERVWSQYWALHDIKKFPEVTSLCRWILQKISLVNNGSNTICLLECNKCYNSPCDCLWLKWQRKNAAQKCGVRFQCKSSQYDSHLRNPQKAILRSSTSPMSTLFITGLTVHLASTGNAIMFHHCASLQDIQYQCPMELFQKCPRKKSVRWHWWHMQKNGSRCCKTREGNNPGC